MKKLVLSCVLVLSLLHVTTWGSIHITATDIGNGQLRIGYSIDDPYEAPPIGISLAVSLSNDAIVAGSYGVLSTSSYFPVYPDYASAMAWEPIGYEIGDGHPLADLDGDWWVADFTDSSYFSISMGAIGDNYGLIPPGDISDPGYEYHPSDFNCDGEVGLQDLEILASEWRFYTPPDPVYGDFFLPGDLNMDHYVDMLDYAMFMGPATGVPLEVNNLITLQLMDGGLGTTDVTIEAYLGNGNPMPMDVVLPEPITVVVPEPVTFVLLTIGGLLIKRRG